METRRTFKKGESLDSLAQFVRVAADEVTGDTGAAELPSAVRITVSTVSVDIPRPTIEDVVDVLGLGPGTLVAERLEEFLDYRRDEKKKPIRTIAALTRILKPFEGKPIHAIAAIDESMTQGWTGLFVRDQPKNGGDRFQDRGESDGGTW